MPEDWHATEVLVVVLAAPLPAQLPAHVPGKTGRGFNYLGTNNSCWETWIKFLDQVPKFWFGLALATAVTGGWRLWNQEMQALSLFQINKQKS